MLKNTNWKGGWINYEARQSPQREKMLKVFQDRETDVIAKNVRRYVGEDVKRGWIPEDEDILLVLFVVFVGGMIIYNNMDYFVDNRKKKGYKKKK